MLDVLGVERACLVQPSVHGADNTAMLDAIRESNWTFRGIAVVEKDVTDTDLQRLHDGGVRGVRGLRINLQFDGRDALDGIEKTAERIAPMGWHLQFLADIANFADVLPHLHRLPVDVLFDHLGHMPAANGLDAQPFQNLLTMMGDGGCWVKLSGPYRTTRENGVPFSDTLPFVHTLVAAAPDRVIWGTDWPHPHLEIPMVNDGDLTDLLAEWIPEKDTRHRILVEIPARLFGFEDRVEETSHVAADIHCIHQPEFSARKRRST
jgi:predicted TIM-barrel fold metal-dependent hydrolase